MYPFAHSHLHVSISALSHTQLSRTPGPRHSLTTSVNTILGSCARTSIHAGGLRTPFQLMRFVLETIACPLTIGHSLDTQGGVITRLLRRAMTHGSVSALQCSLV